MEIDPLRSLEGNARLTLEDPESTKAQSFQSEEVSKTVCGLARATRKVIKGIRINSSRYLNS
jgi:hypothetical protein